MNGIEWNLRFVKRLTNAGLTISEANDILIARGGATNDEEESPEGAADFALIRIGRRAVLHDKR